MKGLTLFGPMFVFFFVGIPVAFAIGLACILYSLIIGQVSLQLIPQRMFATIFANYVYVAIPLFIFAGYVMETGGISDRLFSMVKTLFPRLPGGMGSVTLLTCAFFGAMTGSVIATGVAMATLCVPIMLEMGYSNARASALTAAGAILGPIIPPSITMIVYAATMAVSIPDMFIGSIIPGILICFLMMVPHIMWCKKNNIKMVEEEYTWNEKVAALRKSIGALAMPIIILGGIYGGIFTPTEAGCIACVWAVILMIVYKTFSLKTLFNVALRTGVASAGVMLICAFANSFNYILTVSKVAEEVSTAMLGILGGSQTIYLLVLMFILFVAGCLMDTTAIILIIGPILVPIGIAMGIDPLHLGIAFCCNIILGYATPPFGMALFTVQGVTKVEFGDMVREVWPMLIAASVGCLLVALFPDISLCLVNLMK